jgi:hypothetical protein
LDFMRARRCSITSFCVMVCCNGCCHDLATGSSA